MMESNWVDFKAVKGAVSMQMALDHYGINWLRTETGDLVGKCPIHEGDGKRAFRVSISKNAFNCFSCKAKGNVLDFVAAMETCSVRDAALKLKEWFTLTMPETSDGDHSSAPPSKAKPATAVGESEAVNKPLKFELKGIDPAHPYLAGRGITRETAERFGVGFFPGRGSMSGRVVIPIHNEKGELVAYAGRSVDDTEPKYKLPVGFRKSLALFNYHRVLKEAEGKPMVLVEGFFDCMKVDQAGLPAVSLMGCSLSESQERMLVANFDRVIIMFDGDEAGRKAAGEVSVRIVRKVFVRVVDVGDNRQPDQLSTQEIIRVLGLQ